MISSEKLNARRYKMNLEGKIIDFLGDSITEGVGVGNCETGRYDNIIKKKCNLKAVCNHGICGTRLAHQSKPSENPRFDLCFCGRAYDLSNEADIIVVYGGVNDYMHGDAPFGSNEDKTPATFMGAVEFIMNLLKELYPNTKIIFMTPAHCCFDTLDESQPSNRPQKYSDARPLCDYADVIEQKGKLHGIPVLNLFKRLPINPCLPTHKEKYTSDGLHLNDNGHKILADLLIDFISNEVEE